LERAGAHVRVVEEGQWQDSDWDQTDALVLSPGPGLPDEHPQLLDVLKEAVDRGVPVLGVCLGMQAIHVLDGGALTNMDEPLHGRVTSVDWHRELPRWEDLWKDMPTPMEVGLYHSWVVDESTGSDAYNTIARNTQGWPMARVHRSLPIAGVQFHPESVLTHEGRALLRAWLDSTQRCLAISASKVSLKRS
jgi:anthranilate synthase component 2